MPSLRYRPDRDRWQLDYLDADGVRRRPYCAAGTTERQAREQLRDIEAGIRSGLAPRRRRASSLTLGDLLADWQEAHEREWAPGTTRTRAWFATKYILPVLGGRPLVSLTVADVQGALDVHARLAPRTRAIIGETIRGACRWGLARGLLDIDPTAGLVLPRNRAQVPCYLTHDEYARVLAACEGPRSGETRDGIVLTVRTGLRAGELVALRWEDWQGTSLVVQRAVYVTVRAPKSGKARRVPVHPEAAEVLERRRRAGGEWVYRGPQCAERWKACCAQALRRAGIQEGAPHLLRHTFASWWVQDGGSILALQRILGHATLAMTMVYAHLAPDSAELEAERIWGRLGTRSTTDRAG